MNDSQPRPEPNDDKTPAQKVKDRVRSITTLLQSVGFMLDEMQDAVEYLDEEQYEELQRSLCAEAEIAELQDHVADLKEKLKKSRTQDEQSHDAMQSAMTKIWERNRELTLFLKQQNDNVDNLLGCAMRVLGSADRGMIEDLGCNSELMKQLRDAVGTVRSCSVLDASIKNAKAGSAR